LERRLAAIMAADVVGYSRLIRIDEDGTLATLKSLHAGLIGPKIAERHGRVVKLMGDGLLAEFASVVEAVRAATELQQAMAERNAGLPEGQRIEFRIGVNLGDVAIDGDDIHGDGVNVAARLEALAETGGVTVSGAVHDEVRDRLQLRFEDMGQRQVKNIDRPVRVWRWLRPGAAPAPETAREQSPPLPDRPSVVVLPFTNMSRDADQEYFSDGITEDVITDLSKVSGLFVIARNSAFVYKDKAVSVPHVCRELGVAFALEGSIRRAGNRIRVTAQLIDGSSGGHLWAERYDRELTDIFEVQDDITRQIVRALKVTLGEAARPRGGNGGRTPHAEAHDLFLKGRELLRAVRKETFEEAVACFSRANELDPDYAAPYAGLANASILDHQNRWSDAPEEALDRANRLAGEAIARDDRDPYSHLVASLAALFKRDHQRAADEADRALALNPNYAPALNARGVVPLYTGQPEEAIPYIERAMRLDPAAQQQALHFLGTARFLAGDFETAAALYRDRILVNPGTDLSRAFLASALGHLGRPDEARQVWRELKEINPKYDPAGHVGRLPFRDARDPETFIAGLRKAGLME
jgi:adenylate cyclase